MAGKNALGFGGSANSTWKKGEALFKFVEDKGRVKIKLDGTVYVIKENMLPDIPEKISEKEEYFVELRLDEDGEEVEEVVSIRPVQWMGLKMKCVDFTRNESEEPAPYEKTATYNGKEVTYQAFTAFMECLDGEFKGVKFPYWMHYKFENDGTGMARWAGNIENKKATRLRQCVEFFVMMGAVEEPIEWPDDGNILPELLARIKAAGVVVETAGKEGYITEMIPAKVPVKASFDEVVREAEAKAADKDEWGDDVKEEDW